MGKHKIKVILGILAMMFLSLTACDLLDLWGETGNEDEPSVEDIVQATLTAIAMEQSTDVPKMPTITSPPETGAISGSLGFPSEYIPPLRVVAFDIDSQDYYYVDTVHDQADYQITDLPPGTYHVVAYVREEGPDIPGAYTEFVTCGQTVDCTDHSLIDVVVSPGAVTEGVDPIDFYAQLDEVNWPENPTP